MKHLLTAALAATMLTACTQPQAVETEAPKKDICIQLYSVRTVLGDSASYAENHETALRELADMGYTDVEAANYSNGKFYGVAPEQFKSDCNAAGLNPLSSHATYGLSDEELRNHDFTAAMEWWDKAIEAHKAAGMTYIVTPWNKVPASPEEARTLVDYHNQVGEKCAAAGLKYGYHTHSHEFQKIPGTDTVWIEYFMDNTKPENMFWQLDTFWAVKAGVSPVAYIKKYAGRLPLLHVKDLYELGQSGMVDLRPIFEAAAPGLEGFVVEQEGTDGTHTILEGMEMNADYLRNADFVKPSYRK